MKFIEDFGELTNQSWDGVGHDLVEDVVGALQGALRDDTRLLQQVGLDVGAGQLAQRTEVDADELTLLVAAVGSISSL